MTDDRFLRQFGPTIYKKYGKMFGMKIFPDKEMKETTENLQKLF